MIVQRRLQATNDAFLFPGAKPGKSISENTMIYACYRMGYLHRQTVHGFRGLGSTWANEAERAFVERMSGAIIILLIFLMAMNIVAIVLRRRFERRW